MAVRQLQVGEEGRETRRPSLSSRYVLAVCGLPAKQVLPVVVGHLDQVEAGPDLEVVDPMANVGNW